MSAVDLSAAASLSEPKLEALIEIMFLAASADGEFSDEEKAHFKASIRSLTSAKFDDAALDARLDGFATALERDGREARLAAVKEQLPEMGARKIALSLAIQVTAADGIIRTSERELILETAEALGIDGDEAANLVAKLSP